MSQRKIILLTIASVVIIGGTYLAAALHQKAAGAAASHVTIGLENSTQGSEMKSTDELITFWKQRFERDPKDFISLAYLGQTYMHKGRETGDVSQYEKADAVLRQAIALDPKYEPALAYLSADLFVKHDFLNALQLANSVYTNDPLALQALATVGDAQLELGRYSEAQASYDLLGEKSPSAAVFSRLARLAWLQGHPNDAIRWMQKAVDNSNQIGLTGENAAWYHFQLGELYFNTNQLPKAEAEYTAALRAFNPYYLALAGLGKVQAAEGRYTEAIPLYEKAVAIIPQPDLLAALGDLYSVTGQHDKAESEYRTVEFIGKLQAINQVVYNRLLALYDANHDRNLEESLNLAQHELANRKDIYAYDTAAWALYKNRQYAEALQDMQQAMKLGTRDALLYYHAGMIYSAMGNETQAQSMLSQAMALNPHFDLIQARIARTTLANLQAHTMGR